jgi:hypothetical protein
MVQHPPLSSSSPVSDNSRPPPVPAVLPPSHYADTIELSYASLWDQIVLDGKRENDTIVYGLHFLGASDHTGSDSRSHSNSAAKNDATKKNASPILLIGCTSHGEVCVWKMQHAAAGDRLDTTSVSDREFWEQEKEEEERQDPRMEGKNRKKLRRKQSAATAVAAAPSSRRGRGSSPALRVKISNHGGKALYCCRIVANKGNNNNKWLAVSGEGGACLVCLTCVCACASCPSGCIVSCFRAASPCCFAFRTSSPTKIDLIGRR